MDNTGKNFAEDCFTLTNTLDQSRLWLCLKGMATEGNETILTNKYIKQMKYFASFILHISLDSIRFTNKKIRHLYLNYTN